MHCDADDPAAFEFECRCFRANSIRPAKLADSVLSPAATDLRMKLPKQLLGRAEAGSSCCALKTTRRSHCRNSVPVFKLDFEAGIDPEIDRCTRNDAGSSNQLIGIAEFRVDAGLTRADLDVADALLGHDSRTSDKRDCE
jgi:hypothetical protein